MINGAHNNCMQKKALYTCICLSQRNTYMDILKIDKMLKQSDLVNHKVYFIFNTGFGPKENI